MDFISEIPQGDFYTFLLWLIGNSTIAVALTAWVLHLLHDRWGRELTDTEKKVVSVATPLIAITIVYIVIAAFSYEPWSVDAWFNYVKVAILAVIGGQGVFQFIWNPVGKALESRNDQS